MAQQLLILSTICLMSLVLLGVVAAGTGNTQVEVIRNHGELAKATDEDQPRTRRDVATQVAEQSVAAVASGRANEGETNANANNIRNSAPPNFGELRVSNIVKRAPSGFTGMRGKKEYEITDYSSSNALGWGDEDLNPARYHDNDADYDDDNSGAADSYNLVYGKPNGRRFKKTPTAFYGVRGKKYATGGQSDFNRLDAFMQQLEEQRLRETMLRDFIDRLAVSTVAQNEIAKRAPTGFTGMRGKRPAVGVGSYYNDYNDAVADNVAAEKRAPSNAFVGVRGKKDVSHQAFKRSPSAHSFNNARGGGGGGKNQRFVDFSNKFVAVRGKKASGSSTASLLAAGDIGDSSSDDDDWSSELVTDGGGRLPAQQRLYVNMLPSLLFGGGLNDKRTPSGFMGMRGKREAKTNAAALAAVPVE